MSNNKAIFLDRDGMINVEKNYLYKIEDFEFLPGVIDALRLLKNAGYLLIVVTNQSGIARGYYTEEQFTELNDWMIKELADNGVKIDAVYYCPHHPEAKVEKYRTICNCRKPAIGMYEKAASDFDLDLSQCYAIGDKIRDCGICEATECRGVLLGENEKAEVVEAVKKGKYRRVVWAKDLRGAAEMVVRQTEKVVGARNYADK